MGKSNTSNNYTEFFYKAFRNVLLISIPLVIISALVLSLPHSSASTDQIEFSLSVSCTISSIVNTAHAKEITNGTYHSNVGKTTITALCNDGNGYTVYATGYSDNEVGNNKLINTTNSQYSIDTGLATSGLTSTWAMKLNNLENDPSSTPPIIESAYDDTYGLVPNNWTKVASRPSGTTDMNLGSSFTTTYSIYTSSSQFAGTYRGQVKYLLTHPNSNAQHFFMQNVAEWKDSVLRNEGDSIQAIDQRDGKTYWVTKLADGHIWMTQNLDFDINHNTTLNSITTDLNTIYDSSTGKYAEYNDDYSENNGIIYWTPTSTATTIDFEGTTVTGWTNSNTTPYSASKTDSTGTGHASLGNYYNWTAAIASNNSSSLTANTYDNVANNPKNSICPKGWRLPTISGESETLSGSTNEFARLNYLYNNNSTSTHIGLINQPIYFIRGGYISSSSSNLGNYSVEGLYRSSSLQNASNAYALDFGNGGTSLGYPGSRKGGYSIRCISR